MIRKFVSRRHFIEKSVTTGLAVGLGLKIEPLRRSESAISTETDGLTLKVSGDLTSGYGAVLVFNGRPILRHNQGGEFSALFQNEERSVEDHVNDWKATSWSGDATHVALEGECKLKNLNTTVFVHVDYKRITARVVRKKIRLRQADMFLLFYQLSNRLEPQESPAKLWSFDELDWQGGAVHEYFPAGGFRMKNGLCIGLLTDSGCRNQWTRIIRRDGRPVKPAPRRLPDANLYSGSSPEERSSGNFFVQQTFGEVTQQVAGAPSAQSVPLPEISSWRKIGAATLEERDGAASLSTRRTEDGVIIPFGLSGSAVLSLRLEYRSAAPVALEIWRVDEKLHKINDITLYNDGLPQSPEAWSEFQTTAFLPEWQGHGIALFLSVAPSEQALNLETPH